jgi:APA family basic amino acid/polyamine antiporter
LKLTGAISLVVGTVIGTGIFLKTTVMAQQVGSPEVVLLVWVAAGLLSLAGALTYAELGGMIPKAGGDYVYLRAAYGICLPFSSVGCALPSARPALLPRLPPVLPFSLRRCSV